MKKILVSLLVAVLAVSSIPAFADNTATLSFNAADKSINVVGKTDSPDIPITLAISEYTGGKSNFSENNLPLVIKIIDVLPDGTINYTTALPSKLENRKYTAYFSSEETGKQACDFIFFDSSSAESIDVLSKLKSAKSTDSFKAIVQNDGYKLGIDAEAIGTEDFNNASKSMFEFIKENCTAEEFYNSFNGFVALSMIENGKTDDALNRYFLPLGMQYDECLSVSDKCKTEITSVLKNNFSAQRSPVDIFKEVLIISKFRITQNYDEVKKLLTSNEEIIGITGSLKESFENLSSYHQSDVYQQMLAKRSTVKSLDDIRRLFKQTVNDKKEDSGSGSGSGSSSGAGNAISSSGGMSGFKTEAQPIVKETVIFPDIKNHFAQDYIISLYKKGVISGYPDGTFKPDNAVTRAEFSKIICTAFEYQPKGERVFEDVCPLEWYGGFVNTLANNEIITGYAGYFRPNDNLTREDAATIINRITKFSGFGTEIDYKDAENISDYALSAIKALSDKKILNGDGINFNPKNNVTRGEVCAIISRTLNCLLTDENFNNKSQSE